MGDQRQELLARLRRRLQRAKYDSEALGRLLAITSLDDIGVLNHPAAVERIRAQASPAAVLARTFFLEIGESRQRLERVLGRRLLQSCCEQRLLTAAGKDGMVRARLRIDPVGEQYFLADLRFAAAQRRALGLPGGDDVYPASSDSLLLRRVTSTAADAHVLDLCTGSGVQGLLQAPAARSVTAVDINPRAAAVAACNASFNGAGNFEVKLGDLYAAVGRQRFDLILANPPFVVSPYSDAPSYHAGGPRGDLVLRRVLAGLATRLTSGGRAFAIAHVGLRREDELETIARRWFKSFEGRAAVLLLEQGGAIDLAAAQALFALRRGTVSYGAEIRRWLEYLDRHRIRFVGLILVVAENRGGRSLEVIDARPRVLPLPLTPGPEQRIESWLGTPKIDD